MHFSNVRKIYFSAVIYLLKVETIHFSNVMKIYFSAVIYLLKVKKRNTRTRCEICSTLTIKAQERRQGRGSGVFIVNLEHISHLALMFLLLTLNI